MDSGALSRALSEPYVLVADVIEFDGSTSGLPTGIGWLDKAKT